jgi:hypothetical protein
MLAALDPHYVCAQVGEQAGAKRAGEHVSEIQNPDTRQWRDKGCFGVGGHGFNEYSVPFALVEANHGWPLATAGFPFSFRTIESSFLISYHRVGGTKIEVNAVDKLFGLRSQIYYFHDDDMAPVRQGSQIVVSKHAREKV